MSERLQMLKELTEAAGVPGFEHEVRQVIRRYLEPYAAIEMDNLGSIVCRKDGSARGPRIMLPGHMDEIGFMVSSITRHGFLRFVPMGGWWEHVVLAQRVTVKTRKGDVVGVVGSSPPHLLREEARKKLMRHEEMYVDIGAADEKEARDLFGVRPGDPVIPYSPFTCMRNEKMLLAKAWDDRVGCGVFTDVVKALSGRPHPNTVYAVGTVQEEVGLRGAKTAAEMINPDICLALEVGVADDTPSIREEEPPRERLGHGPVIGLLDASMVAHCQLRDLVVETAEAHGIPHQFSVASRGGTDAGRVHLHARGVPSIVIGVPTRYIHSQAGIIHLDDYENAVRLVVEVVARLDAKTVKDLLK